jgi:phosphatidate phosphatase APP1
LIVRACSDLCMLYSLTILSAVLAMTSDIRSDEQVVFYPTAAHQNAESGVWTVPIHGVIFEPEEGSVKRRVLLAVLRRSIKLDKEDEQSEIFRQRISKFLVDNERGKRIVVRLGKREAALPKSAANGHFRGSVELPVDEAKELLRDHGDKNGWVKYAAVMRAGDERIFAGRVQFVPVAGVSVISDIDDTIKISNVTDREELLRNTFLKPMKPVPGIAKQYQTWAKDGAVFHYLSASPWQLYEPLANFRTDAGLPAGTIQLRNFRLKDSTALDFLSSSVEYKQAAIEDLLSTYPKRTFILVGDSGEHDPEIYAATYRKHASRILCIAIRNVTDGKRDDARFKKAMQGVPDGKWQLFEKAEMLGGKDEGK